MAAHAYRPLGLVVSIIASPWPTFFSVFFRGGLGFTYKEIYPATY